MKRTLLKLIAFIMAIGMTLSMAACDLVTLDNEKVSEQVVATVKVYDGAPEEKITNGQLISVYNAYAYTYIYYYGYTAEETAEVLLDTLIQSKVYAQTAMNYFNTYSSTHNGEAYADLNSAVTDVWNVERYLTADEITEATYNVKKSVNDAIDGYMDTDEEVEEEESYSPTVRTAPTGASNYTHEMTVEEMADYKIDTGIYAQGSENASTERRNAYYKLLKSMDASGYIDEDFDWNTDSVVDTKYFKDSLKEQEQEILITKYDAYLAHDYYTTVTLDNLATSYASMYKAQEESYKTSAEYYDALSNASAANPVVYNPNLGSYAYVYNLLLGIDSVQTEEIAELKEKYEDSSNDEYTEAWFRVERNKVLDKTYVKDLRDTWVTAGYDFDTATNKFLNGYAIAESTLPYNGTVTWTNKTVDGKTYEKEAVLEDGKTYFKYYTLDNETKVYDDEYAPKYTAVSNTVLLNNFVDYMDTYLYGEVKAGNNDAIDGIPVYKTVDHAEEVSEWDEKINELMFAYSTDPGSLNTYKGYAINPKTENGSDTYVAEFSAAARKLVSLGEYSYVMVGTEYGYHVIFLSEAVSATSYATLSDYLASIDSDKDWNATYNDMLLAIRNGETEEYEDMYLYTLQQAVTANAATANVAEIKTGAFNSAKDTSKVTIYTKRMENVFKA